MTAGFNEIGDLVGERVRLRSVRGVDNVTLVAVAYDSFTEHTPVSVVTVDDEGRRVLIPWHAVHAVGREGNVVTPE